MKIWCDIQVIIHPLYILIKYFGYSPFVATPLEGRFVVFSFFTVVFHLFLPPAGALTLQGNHLTQLNLT